MPPKSYHARLDKFLGNESKALELIATHLSQGGTLTEFCEENDYRYQDIVDWLEKQPSRDAEHKKAITRRQEILLDDIISNLRDIVRTDISKAYHPISGDPLPMNEWPTHLRQSLASYDEDVQYNPQKGTFQKKRKFRVHDKLKSVELLGKYLGIWVEKQEVSGTVNVSHSLESAEKRWLAHINDPATIEDKNKHALPEAKPTTAFAKEPRHNKASRGPTAENNNISGPSFPVVKVLAKKKDG